MLLVLLPLLKLLHNCLATTASTSKCTMVTNGEMASEKVAGEQGGKQLSATTPLNSDNTHPLKA